VRVPVVSVTSLVMSWVCPLKDKDCACRHRNGDTIVVSSNGASTGPIGLLRMTMPFSVQPPIETSAEPWAATALSMSCRAAAVVGPTGLGTGAPRYAVGFA
jgi:hypothetical protein